MGNIDYGKLNTYKNDVGSIAEIILNTYLKKINLVER